MSNQTPLNPDALEVAAKALYDHFKNQAANDGDSWPELEERDEVGHGIARDDAEVAVSAYLDVAQLVVNSVEERDQLPVGTIARSAYWLVAVKSANGWLVAGYSKEFRILDLPFTVLDRPEVDE